MDKTKKEMDELLKIDIEAAYEAIEKQSGIKPNTIGFKGKWYKLVGDKYKEVECPHPL